MLILYSAISLAVPAPVAAVDAHRPLPLAAHWNTGRWGEGGSVLKNGDTRAIGITPEYQLELLSKGHNFLPGLYFPPAKERSNWAYYAKMVSVLKEQALPVTLIATQWERVLVEDFVRYRSRHRIKNNSRASFSEYVLHPHGPEEDWYNAGLRWTSSVAIQRLIRTYPNPPEVIFLSNNEQKKHRPHTKYFSDNELAPTNLSAKTKFNQAKRELAQRWEVRYQALFSGMLQGLKNTHWQQRVRFVGYNALVPTFIGRWDDWAKYSDHYVNIDQNSVKLKSKRKDVEVIAPWAHIWQGASVSYYLHDWNNTRDFGYWSPQVESMGWLPVLDGVRKSKPNFWFEISVWDGYNERQKNDKFEQYRKFGQTLTPDRYKNMIRFGMWLTKPRVVREFRHYYQDRKKIQIYFDQVLAAVDEVHLHPVLQKFWQQGQVVINHVGQHPYKSRLPITLQNVPRWFDHSLVGKVSPLNKNAPEVFTLVMKIPGRFEYLVFAYSPTGRYKDVKISLTDLNQSKPIPIRLSPKGVFVHIVQSDMNKKNTAVIKYLSVGKISAADQKLNKQKSSIN